MLPVAVSRQVRLSQPVNLVLQGSANIVTAKFPIIGYFTNGDEFFFQSRVVAPLLKGL